MGRGRAKAKQTKVARQLKYSGPDTDFGRLQAELSSQSGEHSDHDEHLDDEYDAADDPYARYVDEVEGELDDSEDEDRDRS